MPREMGERIGWGTIATIASYGGWWMEMRARGHSRLWRRREGKNGKRGWKRERIRGKRGKKGENGPRGGGNLYPVFFFFFFFSFLLDGWDLISFIQRLKKIEACYLPRHHRISHIYIYIYKIQCTVVVQLYYNIIERHCFKNWRHTINGKNQSFILTPNCQ